MTDWGIPLNDGFESVSLDTLAPELRAGPPTPPTQSTDVYALGRLAYFILNGGEHRPVDPAIPTQLTRGNLSKMLPQLNQLEIQMPGAADLLVAWLVDRQPIAESLQQQYLLLSATQRATSDDDTTLLLTGWAYFFPPFFGLGVTCFLLLLLLSSFFFFFFFYYPDGELDTAMHVLGLPGNTPCNEARLCAVAVRQLGLSAAAAGTSAASDQDALLRRCGLPGVSGVALADIVKCLPAGNQRNTPDLSLLWMLRPQLQQPLEKLFAVPNVRTQWFHPMQMFCSTRGAALPEERARVHELLCRCGWAEQPEALRLVLDELQWNTTAVLHFALELLRPLHDTVWTPLADTLLAKFGAAAVKPLTKLLDPGLTLALVIAAPDRFSVLCKIN
mgnify:CR=1 FL=1